ncbi:MAG: hypothetical protein OXU61_04600, partial [Gammaproteobacteria bacterium]|nr:hypothetical protein [Gammaproteobacteria bacterium]
MNLSDVPFSTTEVALPSKGLSFFPTPLQLNTFQLHNDLKAFYRWLRLKEFFYHSDHSEEEEYHPNPFRRNKKKCPPPP